MEKYLAEWNYRDSITLIAIIKETDSSVWVLERGKEQRRAKETETSMYCPTYRFAREKIIQEKQKVIDRDRNYLEHKEKMLNNFLEKYTEVESFKINQP